MIHTLLNITRPLFVLDTETTGLTQDARIIELGFQQWGPEGLIKSWRSLINPGIPIPEAAIKVHGITDAKIRACQTCGGSREPSDSQCTCAEFHNTPYFKQLASRFANGFKDCDFAGKNVRFDLRLLASEFLRAKVSWSYAGARVIDADRLEALAIPRHLTDLYKKYTGLEHEGAHGALSDVQASTTVIVKQLEAHATLPRDLDALHELSWPGWLTSDGAFKLQDGVAIVSFGKHRDKPMREVPRDYYDWVLTQSFPEDVKALAAEAKLGRFPDGTS